jgi:hypothetical protein
MLLVCNLHQAWPSYFLSIPYNCAKCPNGWQKKEAQIKCHHWILWEDNLQTQLWWPIVKGLEFKTSVQGQKHGL